MNHCELAEQGSPAGSELLAFNPDAILQLAERADRLVVAMKKIMTAALAITEIKDWCLIGGTPYLQESGSTKVGRLLGVSWTVGDPTIETDEAGYRTYIFKGVFSMKDASIEAEGSRSMKDDFFSRKKGGARRSPDEIDFSDVRQAAYTSCINNGIKRLIPGLRNISLETLADAGLDVSKLTGYSFNASAPSEMSGEAQQQRNQIEAMLKEMCGEESWKRGLQKLTAFTGKDGGEVPGKTELNRISERMLPITYGKVMKEYERWKAGAP